MPVVYSQDYLVHYGIKGQKWGIRRYQNEDGTLTAAGRKRYGVDLDINDKSRTNIARIRKGEAYRRLDYARENNPTNTYRIGQLQANVRNAERSEKLAKKIDRGSMLAAKGDTITRNKQKKLMAYGASVVASIATTAILAKGISNLKSTGQYRAGHLATAQVFNKYAKIAFTTAFVGYAIKKNADNAALRAYNASQYNGTGTIKNIGGQEYKDVVDRRKKAGQ
jgi:hypothetical protein